MPVQSRTRTMICRPRRTGASRRLPGGVCPGVLTRRADAARSAEPPVNPERTLILHASPPDLNSLALLNPDSDPK
jgi:hypothetical protein